VTGGGLEYLPGDRLSAEGRWQMILGDPGAQSPDLRAPTDPLMIPSPDPRSGIQPVLMTPLGPETSENPGENPINGHEYHNTDNSDLQYACIFPLETALVCTSAESCDCQDEDIARNRPLCQAPAGGPAGTTQYFAKAYPASRELEVLKGLDQRGIVASICPKVTGGDPEEPSYGYNPALDFMADIIVGSLDRCLPRALEVEPDGQLPCRVAEATREACDCSALPGRKAPSAELDAAVRSELETRGQCGAGSGTPCSEYCVCEIEQSSGDALLACQSEESPSEQSPGYCYIDAEHTDENGAPAPIGNPALVASCPIGNQRKLRFVGKNTPQNAAPTFIACAGASLGQVK
ncbi:MAG TPA: hypothetical protein VGP93_10325, partial [Polyangiaceae bacterium]|nr:hypothetical protein [Polyangiaceae bacterium]